VIADVSPHIIGMVVNASRLSVNFSSVKTVISLTTRLCVISAGSGIPEQIR
jgi:hypothetical protein